MIVTEIREIDYILAITQCGSMVKAADQLHITQSALSKYIQNLESRLGYSLFQRHKKNRMILSPAGEIYVRYAQKMALERDKMMRELAEHSKIGKDIRIGMGMNIADRHINEILLNFKYVYPQSHISICTQRVRQNATAVINGELEFADCTKRSTNDQLDFYPAYDDYIQMALPINHPLLDHVSREGETGLPWVDIHLFNNESFILQDESCWLHEAIVDCMAQNHFSPKALVTTNSTGAALKLVEQGVGLAFCTTGLAAGYNDICYVYIGEPVYSITNGLIFRKGEPVHPQVRYLAQLFRKYNASPQYAADDAWQRLL